MTDEELELAILQRYVEHHDTVGTDVHKCERELDMEDVISQIIGRPADKTVVKRFHAILAPASHHTGGVLRPCSDSTINKSSHQFHARAFYETGKAPAWERISELVKKLPAPRSIEKEKEQKFRILNSLGQAKIDFSDYSSGLGMEDNLGVLFIDIDNFKQLNTRLTETVVDREILIPFQHLLNNLCLYRGDAYRHGGEEFLMLLPNQTEEEVTKFAERIRQRIENIRFSFNNNSEQITVSIGIAFWPKHSNAIDDLIGKANYAEREAKNEGKNRIKTYEVGNA